MTKMRTTALRAAGVALCFSCAIVSAEVGCGADDAAASTTSSSQGGGGATTGDGGAAAGAGGAGEGGGGGAGGGEVTCAPIELGQEGRLYNTFTFLVETAGKPRGGAVAASIVLPTPGTYDLSDPGSSVDVCSNNCSTFAIGDDEAQIFMAVEGTLTLDEVVSGYTGRARGSFESVRFVEIDRAVYLAGGVEFVRGGDCYVLDQASFDVTGWGADCDAPTDLANTPSGGSCIDVGSACNPVTGAGCDVAGGQTCDFNSGLGSFQCFDPPNDALLCGACGNVAGPFCAAGATCDSNTGGACHRYCCGDGDCGASGVCVDFVRDVVGVCVNPG
jgi:hypothetical protein